MAPTEILAEQHYRNIAPPARGRRDRLPDGAADRIARARPSGGRRWRRSRAARRGWSSGTHALFEAGVEFQRLGLVVIDEQHRFGVLQRAALAGKGAAARRAGDDGDADPALAGADALRRPGPVGDRRAAARAHAGPDGRARRGATAQRVYDGLRQRDRARAARPTSSCRWSRRRRRAT